MRMSKGTVESCRRWADIAHQLEQAMIKMGLATENINDSNFLDIYNTLPLTSYRTVRTRLVHVFNERKIDCFRGHYGETEVGDILDYVSRYYEKWISDYCIPSDAVTESAKQEFLKGLDEMAGRY